MLERLPIAISQVKAVNTSKWKLTKWNQTSYIFPVSITKITKSTCSNIINSIKL